MISNRNLFWEEKAETISLKELRYIQKEKLKHIISYAYNNVDFYKDLFNSNSINPEKINSFENLREIPFTTKKDLANYYPYGFFAVPLKKIIRIHSSSGTTSKPTVVGYTRKDIEIWKNLIARIMVMGGVSDNDIVQIAFHYGLFTGGFGLHYGAEHLGATVIPVSSGNSKRQIMIMRDYKTTTLICTPSYGLHLSEIINEMGMKKGDLSLKFALLGGEPFNEKLRQLFEDRLGIIATNNYGLSEVMGPGVSGECIYKRGMHINEDYFYPEIIDPNSGEVLPEGSKGELVLTTLEKEAMPLIRYRTRDITSIYRDECPCGRTFIKMENPKVRSDDMFIVNGVNIYPTQIEEIIYDNGLISGHYQIFLKKKGYLDSMEIHIEVDESIFFDEMKKQKTLLDNLTEKIANTLGVKATVKFVSPKTIERFEGKSKRVIDFRNNT